MTLYEREVMYTLEDELDGGAHDDQAITCTAVVLHYLVH